MSGQHECLTLFRVNSLAVITDILEQFPIFCHLNLKCTTQSSKKVTFFTLIVLKIHDERGLYRTEIHEHSFRKTFLK